MWLAVVSCFFSLVLSANAVSFNNSSVSCGKEGEVCHGLPGGCTKTSTGSYCEVLAKIKSKGADTVQVDLYGYGGKEQLHLNFTNRWIAVGFSLSGGMPESAVVHCFNDQNGTVQAKLTYNIPSGRFNQGWVGVDQTPLKLAGVSLVKNVLHCSVTLNKKFQIKESSYDLSVQHPLIVATGPLSSTGSIAKHDRKPEVSDRSYAF